MKTYKVLRACDLIDIYDLIRKKKSENFYKVLKEKRVINFYKPPINKKKTLPRSRNIKFNFHK